MGLYVLLLAPLYRFSFILSSFTHVFCSYILRRSLASFSQFGLLVGSLTLVSGSDFSLCLLSRLWPFTPALVSRSVFLRLLAPIFCSGLSVVFLGVSLALAFFFQIAINYLSSISRSCFLPYGFAFVFYSHLPLRSLTLVICVSVLLLPLAVVIRSGLLIGSLASISRFRLLLLSLASVSRSCLSFQSLTSILLSRLSLSSLASAYCFRSPLLLLVFCSLLLRLIFCLVLLFSCFCLRVLITAPVAGVLSLSHAAFRPLLASTAFCTIPPFDSFRQPPDFTSFRLPPAVATCALLPVLILLLVDSCVTFVIVKNITDITLTNITICKKVNENPNACTPRRKFIYTKDLEHIFLQAVRRYDDHHSSHNKKDELFTKVKYTIMNNKSHFI